MSTHKAIENSSFSSAPLFDATAQGNSPEFLNETYAARTGGMGLLYGENCIIFTNRFYRAMHFSAKRGIAIACRLSVRLSVCLSVCNVGEL